jgi:hypothetical protein
VVKRNWVNGDYEEGFHDCVTVAVFHAGMSILGSRGWSSERSSAKVSLSRVDDVSHGEKDRPDHPDRQQMTLRVSNRVA